MAGTLSIVATPIGHLEDITLRALNVLRTVSVIAAEDTRHTRKLLTHYGIGTPTISFHEHNSRVRVPQLIGRLKGGESIALVSDAGTPIVSDPGLELVQGCLHEDIAVDPIPGPSAPLALAVASGFPICPLTVWGFPPVRSKDRLNWLRRVSALENAVTFLEAPHRIMKTLADLATICGERPIVVGRELTKLHQTFYRGSVSEVAHGEIEARGEFTLILGPWSIALPDDANVGVAAERIWEEFRQMTEFGGMKRREAIRALAERHSLSSRDTYAALERAKARN